MVSRLVPSIAITFGLTIFAGVVEAKSVDERLEALISYYDQPGASPRKVIELADKVILLEGKCEAFWRRGQAHNQLENHPAAEKDHRASINYGCGDNSYVWHELGYALYYMDGRELEALKALSKSISLIKDQTLSEVGHPYAMRGYANIDLHRMQAGCSDLKTAENLGFKDPNHSLQTHCQEIEYLGLHESGNIEQEEKDQLLTYGSNENDKLDELEQKAYSSKQQCLEAADYKGCMEYYKETKKNKVYKKYKI